MSGDPRARPSRYQRYIRGPRWRDRNRRHLAAHPWCMAHGHPCRSQTTHHASYLGWRLLGVELPWEKVALCRRAHRAISYFHRGVRVPNLYLLALTWVVIGWFRLERAVRETQQPKRSERQPPGPPATPSQASTPIPLGPFKWPDKPLSDWD